MPSELNVTRAEMEYDVVVVGAGSAGVAAAASAARAGARTLLVERYGFAGGAATTSSVLAYCGLYANGDDARPVVGGIASEVLDGIGRLGVPAAPIRVRSTGNWIVPLNPEVVKVALDRIVVDARVSVLYHALVSGIEMIDGRLVSVEVSGHFGKVRIAARAFVDASGDGDLSRHAGVPAIADQSQMQPASFPLRVGGIPADWTYDRALFRSVTATYNASKPRISAREDGGVVLRVPGSSETWWMALDLDTDPCHGERFSLSEIEARDCGWRLIECLKKADAIFHGCYLASTGPQIGIRESRRPKTLSEVAAEDIVEAKVPADTIALGGWPMEIHHAPGVQQYIPVGGAGYFGIPFGAIRTQVSNLLVAGRLTGADHNAYGSVRVMGTAFATGQAAGVAAAMFRSTNTSIETNELRVHLRSQGAVLSLKASEVA